MYYCIWLVWPRLGVLSQRVTVRIVFVYCQFSLCERSFYILNLCIQREKYGVSRSVCNSKLKVIEIITIETSLLDSLGYTETARDRLC